LIKQGILIERKRFKMRNYFLILLLLPQLVFAQKMDLDADFGGSLPSIRSRPVTKSSAEKESVSYYCSLELDRELKHNWIVSLGLDMYQIKTRIHNVYEPKAIVTKQYFADRAMPLHLSISKRVFVGKDYFLFGIDAGAMFSFAKGGYAYGNYADNNQYWRYVDYNKYPFGFGYVAGINLSYTIYATPRLAVRLAFKPRYNEYTSKVTQGTILPLTLEGNCKISAVTYPLSIGVVMSLGKDKAKHEIKRN